MWHQSHLPYLAAAANTNGLLTYSLPFQQLHHPPTNGLTSELLYHPHSNLWLGGHMGGGGGGYNSFPHHVGMTNGSTGGGKKSQCYNCGQTGHWAADCKEPTMDAMSHGNGQSLLLCYLLLKSHVQGSHLSVKSQLLFF